MQTALKTRLRRQARQNRAALPLAFRARAAAALPDFLPDILNFCTRFGCPPTADVMNFALYYPIGAEADTRPLIAALQGQNIKTLLPALLKNARIGEENMVFRAFSPGQTLCRGAFGIYEPELRPEAAAEIPQALLLPLLAFDAQGNRLGYGGGYYDKAIAALRRRGLNPPLIGLGFQAQLLPFIPAEPHDIALHAVLTERGLHSFTSAACQ